MTKKFFNKLFSSPARDSGERWRIEHLPNGGFRVNAEDILNSREYEDAVKEGKELRALQMERREKPNAD